MHYWLLFGCGLCREWISVWEHSWSSLINANRRTASHPCRTLAALYPPDTLYEWRRHIWAKHWPTRRLKSLVSERTHSWQCGNWSEALSLESLSQQELAKSAGVCFLQECHSIIFMWEKLSTTSFDTWTKRWDAVWWWLMLRCSTKSRRIWLRKPSLKHCKNSRITMEHSCYTIEVSFDAQCQILFF